ncbi:putative WD repeat-containing protein [Wickerhamomyces ciferrii]|uniref:WD repeat-containing protein n=1 Tax=Wickerhamomyces ciferrii (strain ATCC 14091 / BCRC 22168 / CBS 111 / JCM 3599 / NBRC 0793 / NRRL Y-1031 F-60-10) TaxID=1206466 RepID=K0KEW7_WICCF|nr:putative WD repeat-containing protein [Wickerhamomyces ciferrii]CCH43675.1 putative WD repeat-containing protein [Wickerhamomyces ciferrii]
MSNRKGSNLDDFTTPSSPSRSTTSSLGSIPHMIPQSPRKKKLVYSDRHIPNRSGVDLQAAFSVSNDDLTRQRPLGSSISNDLEYRKEEEASRTFNKILKNELFGDNIPSASSTNSVDSDNKSNNTQITPPRTGDDNSASTSTSSLQRTPRHQQNHTNLFSYQSPNKSRPTSSSIENDLYSLSPVRVDSQRLLLSPTKKPRAISKVPYRVLDAPDLVDDFYLNLLDWGSQDILGVGLGSSVYLWNASSGSVDKLCDLSQNDKITSLSWIGSGSHLAIGTNNSAVQIWDAATSKCTRTMTGHDGRVNALSWNEHILSSGSRDRTILHRDVRDASHYVGKITSHKQEICGLKWNVDENKLASGGNDNKLYVWDGLNTREPLHRFEHNAAIKALSWSPHQRGVLASGGGTTDRRIKTWNVLNGTKLTDIDTGSQVCNLCWSINSTELVSTHGYSKNQIMIWKYPQMQQIASLSGHTYRVLYLALSPDGQTVVTGSGDETLRFWNVFEKNKHDTAPQSVLLDAFMQLR